MNQKLKDKIHKIKLIATDVDGVLTDGGMYYSSEGEIMKKFHTRDAVGLRLLQEQNIHVGKRGHLLSTITAHCNKGKPVCRSWIRCWKNKSIYILKNKRNRVNKK